MRSCAIQDATWIVDSDETISLYVACACPRARSWSPRCNRFPCTLATCRDGTITSFDSNDRTSYYRSSCSQVELTLTFLHFTSFANLVLAYLLWPHSKDLTDNYGMGFEARRVISEAILNGTKTFRDGFGAELDSVGAVMKWEVRFASSSQSRLQDQRIA